ncbi:MAG: glycosyltransferase family 4 protein [Gammaproteobacteria bacterium]|nr:glycosyltransferase family 4 protein [Gammaproteobacteria bacterium]
MLLANALLEAGHTVELLGRSDVPGYDGSCEFRGRVHRAFDFGRTGWKERQSGVFNPLRRHHMARRIRDAVRALGGTWDVVHYHGHLPELGAQLGQDFNFVHTIHDRGLECMTALRLYESRPCTAMEAATCARCATDAPNALQRRVSAMSVELRRGAAHRVLARHRVIFVSRFLQQRTLEALGMAEDCQSTVVHNFIDARHIETLLAVRPPARAAGERLRVFTAGRIDETKGFGEMLAQLDDDTVRRLEIRVGGLGKDLEDLRRRHERRGVRFLGWLDYPQIVHELAACDVAVMPSVVEEACSTFTLEGLTVGRPVYALRRGATPELAVYASAPGQLALFDDMPSLAAALGQLSGAQPARPLHMRADVLARLPEILSVYQAREHAVRSP